jgi:hypothetical protein
VNTLPGDAKGQDVLGFHGNLKHVKVELVVEVSQNGPQ